MKIYINGIGLTGAFGNGAGDFRKAARGMPSPRKISIKLRDGEAELPYYPADTALLERWIPKSKSRRYDSFTRLCFLSAFQALEDAGIKHDAGLEKTGIIIATGYGPVKTNFGFIDSYLDFGDDAPSPTLFSASVYNSAAGALSIHFRTRGPCFTITQFDMSVPQALLTAMQWLNEERCERILVGCADEFHPLIGYSCYKMNGLNSGIHAEGACCFVLSGDKNNSRAELESVLTGNSDTEDKFCGPSGRYGLIPVSQAFDIAEALLNPDNKKVSINYRNTRGDYSLVSLRAG